MVQMVCYIRYIIYASLSTNCEYSMHLLFSLCKDPVKTRHIHNITKELFDMNIFKHSCEK